MNVGTKLIDLALATAHRAAYRDVDLVGHRVRMRVGAQPSGTDYDDGWTLCLLRRSRSFVDIGCNVGHVSLLAGVLGVEAIVAVDANRQALAIAAETLALTGHIERARFASVFVSDTPDEDVDFFTVGSGAAGSRYASHAVTAAAREKHTTVRTTTLDRLVRGDQPVATCCSNRQEWRTRRASIASGRAPAMRRQRPPWTTCPDP